MGACRSCYMRVTDLRITLVVELDATVYPQKYALEQTFGILHYLETSSNSINTLAKALSGHGQVP